MSLDAIQAAPPPSRDPAEALALAVRAGRGVLVSASGEIEAATAAALSRALSGPGITLVHAPFVARRLGMPLRGAIFDLAELFAFAHPARFATPTPQGLAAFLEMPSAPTVEDEAVLLHQLSDRLLSELRSLEGPARESAVAAVQHMVRAHWIWAPAVLEALGARPAERPQRYVPWHGLPEWQETPPRPQAASSPLQAEDVRGALDRLLARALDPSVREAREDQGHYAVAVARIFDPREREDEPNIVLAEAGTGIGKTLGYVAPSALWARKNGGAVWISTYTKNLQRQISQTLARIAASDERSRLKTIVRKGRENYLCLLNFEELSAAPFQAAAAGLIGRWIEATADGDMVGGDFPAWLVPLLAQGQARDAQGLGLTDRRGECIYGACAHYRRCFIERMRVSTEDAEIVIANHAVLLTRAAGDAGLPAQYARAPLARLVLDEGHHLFEAADDAFSLHLTAHELGDLRRFLRGPERQRGRGRARALADRIADLLPDNTEAHEALHRVLRLAQALPNEQWRRNMAEGFDAPGYRFLAAVDEQVRARAVKGADDHGLECTVRPVSDAVAEAAAKLAEVLKALRKLLHGLSQRIETRLNDEADEIDSNLRARMVAMLRSLAIRTEGLLPAWVSMLESLAGEESPTWVVDWFASGNGDGDTGMHRHALDPTIPLARHLYRPAHGVLITSATLFDTGDTNRDMTGAGHLASHALRARFASPFPYAERSRFIVVRDVETRDLKQLAAAMRVLFHAAGGGALGLFTAISRLRAVYREIKAPLEALGLPLYAQHIDQIDPGTLVDIFRSEADSCLLGTDAVREGIDVAGRSLRLLVFERVPWPRPDLLHKARAEHFGGRVYEEEIARRRITQAFGRLIRRGDDKGVFVILGAQVPSRLLTGLPEGVEVERTGLAEAARQIAEFLA